MRHSLIREKRSVCYTILLGVWSLVAIYAVLHDQYIVRIGPEHFTKYHDPLMGIDHPETLAFVYALGASIGPGLALGLACIFAGRAGKQEKISVRTILTGTVVVIVCTESICASLGIYVYLSGNPIFPDFLYPDMSKPMLITQTIQLSCYLLSALFSGLLLLFLIRRRLRYRGKAG